MYSSLIQVYNNLSLRALGPFDGPFDPLMVVKPVIIHFPGRKRQTFHISELRKAFVVEYIAISSSDLLAKLKINISYKTPKTPIGEIVDNNLTRSSITE